MCIYSDQGVSAIHEMNARALDQGCETAPENILSTRASERNTND